jgi:hypothetical protein
MFFASVGFGFVLLEVWLLHQFTSFLGHQVYSLSVVLATLLITTGLGAAVGGKFLPHPRRRALLGSLGVALLFGCGSAILPSLLEGTWQAGLPTRAAVAIAFITPIGLLLGQPFVGGIAWLREHNPGAVPWCIGINGFCSVVGSVGAIPLLMAAGYSGSLVAGVALYSIAALASHSMRTPT